MAGYGTALAFSPAARELKSGAFVTWGARIATQASRCLYLVPFEKEPALSFGPFDASELPYMVPTEKRVGLLGFRGGSRSQAPGPVTGSVPTEHWGQFGFCGASL